MELLKQLQNRRSVRVYTQEEIAQEKLEAIVQAALLGPSSRGIYPAEYIVVRNRASLDALSRCKKGAGLLKGAAAAIVVIGNRMLSDAWIEDCSIAMMLMQLQARCDKLGIKLIVLFAPNKEQIYSEYMPTYTVENEDKREPRLIRYLQEKGITALYPSEALKAGDLYHETYYRYDTHWTPYGAYIADYLIEKELGMEPADPYSPDLPVTEKTISSGDLISLGNLSSGSYPPVQYYVPDVDTEYNVTSDKSSDNGNVRRTESDNPNRLSLVLVGDSFRVNMSEPLTRGFQKTLILHRDYLDASMKDEILNADVLIVEAVERFDILLPGSVWKLLGILPG